jgi:hypothetical protein
MFSKLNPLANVKEFLQNTHILKSGQMSRNILRYQIEKNK